jgi:hypothetical protein
MVALSGVQRTTDALSSENAGMDNNAKERNGNELLLLLFCM